MQNFSVDTSGNMITSLKGTEVLHAPQINKGTAFTHKERERLGLCGLLPPTVLTLREQSVRAYEQYSAQPNDLMKNVYLMALHDRNEVLFYRLLTEHLAEMLPIVYTPTVGLAIQRYSHEYRRPSGVYLSINHPEQIEDALRGFATDSNEIDLIVVTDSERILGIGDWGVGGIDIAIGKLAVYTAAAGIHPCRTIPVVLDVGTNRESLLSDPLYIGNRHPRVSGLNYEAFVDRFVRTAMTLFPSALLHWEDFAQQNARPIHDKYRGEFCTFNDDIQGTGAVSLAAVLSSVKVTGVPLEEQRIVMFGAGSAGIGVADSIVQAMVRAGMSKEAAEHRFWCVDKNGLLTTNMAQLQAFQQPYARWTEEVGDWQRDETGCILLPEVIRKVHPTILIGLSTVHGAFTEEVVREMAAHVHSPVILPLSNPTTSAEAEPQDLIVWTDGRALVATGSPFPPVEHAGTTYAIGQSNNALVFPGIGLGTIVSRASRVTDGMIIAAAEALADFANAHGSGGSLLPQVEDLKEVSVSVAVKVAEAAVAEGVARLGMDGVRASTADGTTNRVAKPAVADAGDRQRRDKDMEKLVRNSMWQPVYRPVLSVDEFISHGAAVHA